MRTHGRQATIFLDKKKMEPTISTFILYGQLLLAAMNYNSNKTKIPSNSKHNKKDKEIWEILIIERSNNQEKDSKIILGYKDV